MADTAAGETAAGAGQGDSKPVVPAPPPGEKKTKHPWFISIYLIIIAVIVLVGLIDLWPEPTATSGPATSGTATSGIATSGTATSGTHVGWLWPFIGTNLVAAKATIVLVLLSGALGGLIHAIRSLTIFVGTGSFRPSWTLWYVARPFEGAAIAIVIYLAIGGGFLAGVDSAAAGNRNIHGIVGISVLAGMFSREALEKLKMVFSALFAPSSDKNLPDGVPRPMTISGATPGTIKSGATTDQSVTIQGENFPAGIKVKAKGKDLKVDNPTATSLVVVIPKDMAGPGDKTLELKFSDGRPGSAPATFSLPIE